MSDNADYKDIPGTYVFDAQASRNGYHLNMFCMSLRHEKNRTAFKANEQKFLDAYPMTTAQRTAVLERKWNDMLALGGNVYYTSKLAACDGVNFQQLAAKMTGMELEAYRAMMLAGGRSIEGNRHLSDWKNNRQNKETT